jgi:hypothetical protein
LSYLPEVSCDPVELPDWELYGLKTATAALRVLKLIRSLL